MRKVYIVLMHTKTLPSRFIKLFTRYPYTHVGISLEETCEEIYSFGRKNINSFLKSGFTIEKKNGAFFKKFHKTSCQIYEIESEERNYNHLKNILNNMYNQKEIYKYDFLGMILRFFKIPYKKENNFVCSYFVASVLSESNILKFSKETHFVEPKDFTKTNELKKIYEGYFSKYQDDVLEFRENKISV